MHCACMNSPFPNFSTQAYSPLTSDWLRSLSRRSRNSRRSLENHSLTLCSRVRTHENTTRSRAHTHTHTKYKDNALRSARHEPITHGCALLRLGVKHESGWNACLSFLFGRRASRRADPRCVVVVVVFVSRVSVCRRCRRRRVAWCACVRMWNTNRRVYAHIHTHTHTLVWRACRCFKVCTTKSEITTALSHSHTHKVYMAQIKWSSAPAMCTVTCRLCVHTHTHTKRRVI